ncbi:hypothetical protein JOF53_007414 [Crossiella equi]|uniref:Transposase Helix-turn-helix domain-containing protein n=1 Tax=Crossiella equi TaxID=130796 RepID=A0ABS5AQ68_9PSEU|nr:transposase family protein [Crossiella equi]MBP2478542.1 hypothetical protein [Crossiella equi]
MRRSRVSTPDWITTFTGLEQREFDDLVRQVARLGGPDLTDDRPGRPWSLPLADRVLLLGTYLRTDLTVRQLSALFGVSHSAAHRVIRSLRPVLSLEPVRRRSLRVVVLVGADADVQPQRLPVLPTGEPGDLRVAIDVDTRLALNRGG